MSIESELRAISRTDDGRLMPQEVVDWAKDHPESELHQHKDFYFDNDSAAANEHRLNVARTLIRVHIVTEEGDRAMISLVQDRKSGGGYRDIEPVMGNTELRRMAVRQALRELRAFERRYNHLRELAQVFEAAERTRTAIEAGSEAAAA